MAAFGFCFLLTLLVATRLPAGFLFPLVILLCGGVAVCFIFRHRVFPRYVPLLFVSAELALLFYCGYGRWVVQPVAFLAGQKLPATARVEEVQSGFVEDTVTATLSVQRLDGKAQNPPIKLQVYDLPFCALGDILELELGFYTLPFQDDAAHYRTKGIFVGAEALSTPRKVAVENTFLISMRKLKYEAGDNIRTRLPQRLSSVAAAMAVGDKRTLPYETVEAYRMAGLSHMLVVSGLHLSILCGVSYGVLNAVFRRKRVAAALCMGMAFLFMAFTGLTPSILRSGIAFLLVMAAALFGREADVYTSMGLAAVLLCLQNPYAAVDAGLQLSFAANIGILAAMEFRQQVRRKLGDRSFKKPAKQLVSLGLAAMVPVWVSLATLPVIAFNGFGVSLFTIPMNLIAVPLLAPIVLSGFVMALPGGFWLIEFLAGPASLIAGVSLAFLERITAFCARFQEMYVLLGGFLATAAILLVYLLVALAIYTRWRAVYFTAAGLIFPLAMAFHLFLDAGTVRLTMAGVGSSASLVVSQDEKAVVLYRGSRSAPHIQRVLERQNIKECVLWVDMRQTAQTTEAEILFRPQRLYIAEEELAYREVLAPLENVEIYLQAQKKGTAACVDILGYKVGLASGPADLSAGPVLDVLIPPSGPVVGEYKMLLVSGQTPNWASPDVEILHNGGSTQLHVRPGKSVVYREAKDDIIP